MTNKNIYLLWGRDLEMDKISKKLKRNNVWFIDNNLSWWAHIDNYKDEIWRIISENNNPVAIELNWVSNYDWVDFIDHHNELSWNKASLLQVLEREGIEAKLFDYMIAANDSGYIPAMCTTIKKYNESNPNKKVTNKVAISMIKNIRKLDRKMQWVTLDDEKEALNSIDNTERYYNERLSIVRLKHSKSSVVVDNLISYYDWYDKIFNYDYKNLLIISENWESNFYWEPEFCKLLKEKFSDWLTWWYVWHDVEWKENKSEKAFFGWYINQAELEEFIKNNIIDYFDYDDKWIINLDNWDLLLNKYWKYEPNITFIFDKKQYFDWWLTDKKIFNSNSNEIIRSLNIDWKNWTFSLIEWDFWVSNNSKNCFRPKEWWKHFLITENWWWAFSKTSWGTFSDDLNVIYHKRASSNWWGSWYDYTVINKDYKKIESINDYN